MTDIVTGGNGFIGSALVAKLSALGRRVLVIDNNYIPTKAFPENVSYSNLDIRRSFVNHSFSFIDRAASGEIDTIYHLAALADIVPSIENPVAYYDTNVTGTLNVLEFARKVGCKKFVYAASSSCYGKEVDFNLECDESTRCDPQYPYALTKYMGEQLVLHWAKVYGVPAISLRLFNVYGEGQRASNAYGAMFKVFLAQLANGKSLTIVGGGNQSRDFVHVSDVVEAFLLAAESDMAGRSFNIASGGSTSVMEIAKMLLNKFQLVEGVDYVSLPERPGEPDYLGADIGLAEAALGWEPKVSIQQGVARLLEHLDEYRDAPVWTPDTIKDATAAWFERLSA